MHYSVYAGLAFSALFGVVAPTITRRTSPALATWFLTIGGSVSALCAVVSLAVLALAVVGEEPEVAEGHWSIRVLHRADPVRTPVGIAALVILGYVATRVIGTLIRRTRGLAMAYRLNRSAEAGGDLVVVASDTLDAYAVPGRPGHVFVTSGMLRLLGDDGWAVMMSHERSHLRHRHHWHRTVVALAAALNPLLIALPRAQLWVTERWADEDAARATARETVASTLARAADAQRASLVPPSALSFTAHTVERRIAALRVPPPRRRLLLLAAAACLLSVAAGGTADGFTDEAALFHAATLVHGAHDTPRLSTKHLTISS